MNADRNLLLGILALQNNFIDRHQLIAAFDRWTADKTKPLGQILLDQGALAADEHELLEALVGKHLQRHGGDAEKSLADLTPVGSVRDELKRLADAEIEVSLAHVSVARADDPYATQPWSAGESTSSGTRFRILRPHARGGLGEVYVARDEELHREVALKEIQERHAHDPDSRSRFLLEAEITGGLEHPGIVPVYGLGAYSDGRPFYAMRFIKGDSLKEAIERFHRGRDSVGNALRGVPRGGDQADQPADGTPQRAFPTECQHAPRNTFTSLDFRKLLGRFIDVCNAIEYAHSRGVLHRDLKPGNIMLGKYGETLVVDWGLAKLLGRRDATSDHDERTLHPSSGGGSSATQMGSAVGTPQYMSPEQAEGRLDQLGPASDVYSLGATLYTLLTGKPAFRGGDVGAILLQVAKSDFPPPCSVNSTLPRPLEAICLKAMSLSPADRYASPRLLADDVERWLADDAVSAFPERVGERAARWARRHRTLLASAGIALLLITIVSTSSALLVHNAFLNEKNHRDRADREAQVAKSARAKAEAAATREANQRLRAERQERMARSQSLAAYSQLRRRETPVQSLLLAVESVKIPMLHHQQVPPTATQSLHDALAAVGGMPLPDYGGIVTYTRYSPDGRWLATAVGNMTIRLWATDSPPSSSVELTGFDARIDSLAISADSCWLAAGEHRLIKPPDAQALPVYEPASVWLWNLKAKDIGGSVMRLKGHTGWVKGLAFSPDSKWLASGDQGGNARLWDLSSGTPLTASIELRTEGPIDSLAFSNDSRRMATPDGKGGAGANGVRVWDLSASNPSESFVRLSAPGDMGISKLAISADGRWLAAMCGWPDENAVLWDLGKNESDMPAIVLSGHESGLVELTMSPDSRWLATGSHDKTVRVWDLSSEDASKRHIVLRGHSQYVNSLAFSPNGCLLASGSADKTIRLWAIKGNGPAPTATVLSGHEARVWELAFSPDVQYLASTSDENSVRVWNLGMPVRSPIVLKGHESSVVGLAVSPNHRWLASGSGDQSVRVWDLKASDPSANPMILHGHEDAVRDVAFTLDGRWLVSVSYDKTARLWRMRDTGADGTAIVLSEHRQVLHSLALSPDGRWLATVSNDKTARLWDLSADDPAASSLVLEGHSDGVHSVAFGPGGRWLATGSTDKTIRLWRLKASPNSVASCFLTLDGHGGHDGALAISPDGRWLASCGDTTAKLWELSDSLEARRRIDLAGHRGGSHRVVFSPDGHWLITSGGYADKKARLWNLAGPSVGDSYIGLEGHDAYVACASFSKDGRWLATGSGDTTIRLWDLKSEAPGASSIVLRSDALMLSLAFSADGKWLAGGSKAGTVRLWHLHVNDLLDLAEGVAGRGLTIDERKQYLVP